MKKTHFACLFLVMVLLMPLVSLAEEAPQVKYVLNPAATDRLNLRAEANTTSEVLARYYTGTVVEVLSATGDFTRVRIGDMEGYMQTSFLSSTRSDLQLGAWGTVSVPGADEKLHLRASTEEGALSYQLYPGGTPVQILEDVGDHYRVRTYDMEGYMRKEFIVVDGDPGKPIMTELTVGQVESESTTLRAFPSIEAMPFSAHLQGEVVTILGVVGTWYYVEVSGLNEWESQMQRGFMPSLELKVGNYSSSGPIDQLFAVVRTANERDALHLRAGASWSSDSLGMFYNASQMLVLSEDISTEGPKPTWVHVMMGETEGHIQGEFIDWVDKFSADTWTGEAAQEEEIVE